MTAAAAGTAAGFMASAPAAPPMSGNTEWAHRYAEEVRRVFKEHAANAPRSLQTRLGPSEIGVECDRQVVGKLAGLPATNHVMDPWPSIRGTALHSWADEALTADNARTGQQRWYPERKVTPFVVRDHHEGHRGSADAYDAAHLVVVDWKFLGSTNMNKIRRHGPPRKYRVQLKLYGLGYAREGFTVARVVLVAVPATEASLDGVFVWEHELGPADLTELAEVETQLEARKGMARDVLNGLYGIDDVTATPDDGECIFCLAGETEVVTDEGVRPIRELAGGVHNLLVPSHSNAGNRGTFQPVPVRALGQQLLYRVTLQRYRATKTVRTTAEHRWVLPDGTVQTTAELAAGQRLASVRAEPSRRAKRINVAVAQGFTYGDGSKGFGRRPATLSIYDRSSADRHVLPFFGPIETRRYDTAGGDKVTRVYGLPRFWKDLPPLDESKSFLLSWLAGYFAADGSVTEDGQATLSSADWDAMLFVRDVAALCGVGHGQFKTKNRLGTGDIETPLFSIDLATRDLPSWFWILPHHAERAAARVAQPARTTHWSVVSVEATGQVEEVFCPVVPDVEAFGLVDGLTTGNCPFYRPQTARDGGPGCPGHAPAA